MTEFMIIAVGFLLSVTAVYLTIHRIYDLLESAPVSEKERPKYRIVSDNLETAGMVCRELQPGDYLLCIKSRPALIAECSKPSADIIVLETMKDQHTYITDDMPHIVV